ncbi:MAG TPA: HEAT repeat domain-containing protein [Terriglobales bacterium]|nr:HEAT repeat domain-containing protein [Terriglobales bacterium]
MNCDWVKANIPLFIYDELTDDARHELQQHCARCSGCAGELESAQGFKAAMSAVPRLEPSPSLLAASRMRLQEALEQAEQDRGWRRWVFDPTAWLRQVRFSPALAAMILMAGFAGGIATTWQIARGGNANNAGNATNVFTPTSNSSAVVPSQEASIAGIRDVSPIPGSNKVEIRYDSLVPQKAEGNLDDPRIQQLLLFAAHSNMNSGVRIDSVDVLAKKPEDAAIREALKGALRYDTNVGVRLKALEALTPYVKDDVGVRDAVLEALLHDSNRGVRTEALNTLRAVRVDGSVRQALEYLANNDKDDYIRRQSRSLLATAPEMN